MVKHPPPLIGLTGGRGAGKDTVASILVAEHGYRSFSFADALRDFVYSTDEGWRLAFDTLGYERAKAEVSGFRQRLDDIGQAARDYLGDKVWINALDQRIARQLHTAQYNFPVVVTDVRYQNEAGYIRAHDGVVIGIDRPYHGVGGEQQAMEVFLSADEWILNDGTVQSLRHDVDAYIGLLGS